MTSDTYPKGLVDIDERLTSRFDAGLTVAVGYQWRGLDFLPELRARLDVHPPRLVVGRWVGDTPPPAWWRKVDQGGGQVVEQATHVFDIARSLAGEAKVVAAASSRWARLPRVSRP